MAVISCSHVHNSLFFFNDTATTEIYTLSLHDALPIYGVRAGIAELGPHLLGEDPLELAKLNRSEEHTSELQSQSNLVCRLLLEKKKIIYNRIDKAIKFDSAATDATTTVCAQDRLAAIR